MAIESEKSIFLAALDCRSDQERAVYLDHACAGDRTLRQAVEELLHAHGQDDNLLDGEPTWSMGLRSHVRLAAEAIEKDARLEQSQAVEDADCPWLDIQVGNYRLREVIGEGGFGQVFVADQLAPIRRRVALKLLKPGMDSREVVARFEAERQALALMDHPHISQVFDAGTTASGRPYFVMELVRGLPITTFCEQQQLTVRERLLLFIDVCRAIQHAHQKGVIHRDLKPSNVLVTQSDTRPVAKVIDFGVAKAICEPLTDKTIYTRLAQLIGTPMYMSPEQGEMNELDVDTRSDIYSLGVMLYELLTGTTPFDRQRLKSANYDELRRILREEDPPRPSVRVSTISRNRTTTVVAGQPIQTLVPVLRGDLDWIVMKALEKDRGRRYDTASDLARDIDRYLLRQPVVARPPSPWYRFQKFARRNLVYLTAATLVLLTLLAGTGISTWQAVRATQAQRRAEKLQREAVEFADRLKQANVLLESARANADEQRYQLAEEQYTLATELQPDHYLTWAGRGSLYARLGAWRTAATDFAKALELGAPANNPGWWGVPQLCLYANQPQAYQLVCERIEAQLQRTADPDLSSFAIRSLCLVPRSPQTAKQLVERAEQIVSSSSLDPRHRHSGPPHQGPPPQLMPGTARDELRPDSMGDSPKPLRHPRLPRELGWYVAGLANLRAGRLDAASDFLHRVEQSQAGFFPAYRMAHPLLAIAACQAENSQAAEQSLAEADQFFEEIAEQALHDSLEELRIPWFDLVEFIVLYDEASRLVRGTSPAGDLRLAEFERRSLAALKAN